MEIEEMRLDGNAAGGVLRQVFVQEMTAALATCAGCGTAGPVGVLLEYGQGMGTVLRCPKCDAPVLRIARVPGRLCVDLSGVGMLTIPDSASLA
jgi:hypothetical protein